jgi:hypothetical protein
VERVDRHTGRKEVKAVSDAVEVVQVALPQLDPVIRLSVEHTRRPRKKPESELRDEHTHHHRSERVARAVKVEPTWVVSIA